MQKRPIYMQKRPKHPVTVGPGNIGYITKSIPYMQKRPTYMQKRLTYMQKRPTYMQNRLTHKKTRFKTYDTSNYVPIGCICIQNRCIYMKKNLIYKRKRPTRAKETMYACPKYYLYVLAYLPNEMCINT